MLQICGTGRSRQSLSRVDKLYDLKPTKIYVLDGVAENPDSAARMRRILAALEKDIDDVVVYDRDHAYEIAREIDAWPGDSLVDGVAREHQRPLVFTNILFDEKKEEDPLVANRPEDVPGDILNALIGYIQLKQDQHSPEKDAELNMVCWHSQHLGTMTGCPHGCHYCGHGKNGKFIAIGANVNEYMEKLVGPTIETYPGQKCFLLIGWGADIIAFEPEYGCFESFLAKLAEYEDHYGYFHTASDNVDWVEHVPNRDRLIAIWSLATDEVARQIEPGSPSATARIEAARKCREWGVPVRFKFKPMIPIRNWRDEYARTIKQIFKRTRPESVGFCVLMWMNFDCLESRIALDLLDPEYVHAARDSADEMRDVRTGPFPHHVRAEIYHFLIREVRRYDKKIPLFISTESSEMWDDLRDELGQNPRKFICGCNPIEAPGPVMMPSEPLRSSTYVSKERRAGA